MDPAIVALALSAGSETDFELFGQVALQVALGIDFEPTGGMHDGGQDGFLRSVVGRPDRYVQISKQQAFKSKITSTIARLKETGRNAASLTYVTPLQIPDKDIIEADIEKSTGVGIRIRDQKWLTITMATSAELEIAFKDRYSAVLDNLRSTTEHIQKRYATTERLSVLVYLDSHEKSEPSKSDLLPLAIDAAIFMALKDTDPGGEVFRTEDEIVDFVRGFFPQLKTRAETLIPARLAHLRTKNGNPRIRFHKSSLYALPYEVRSEFSAQNALLRQVEADFWTSIGNRAKEIAADLSPAREAMVEDAIAFSLTKTFEQQGLNRRLRSEQSGR
jgi:hypothetical protein